MFFTLLTDKILRLFLPTPLRQSLIDMDQRGGLNSLMVQNQKESLISAHCRSTLLGCPWSEKDKEGKVRLTLNLTRRINRKIPQSFSHESASGEWWRTPIFGQNRDRFRMANWQKITEAINHVIEEFFLWVSSLDPCFLSSTHHYDSTSGIWVSDGVSNSGLGALKSGSQMDKKIDLWIFIFTTFLHCEFQCDRLTLSTWFYTNVTIYSKRRLIWSTCVALSPQLSTKCSENYEGMSLKSIVVDLSQRTNSMKSCGVGCLWATMT